MLKFHNINKSFSTSHQSLSVLNNVSLEVKSGEIYGLLGKSGAGKSTLLRCANLLTRPCSGQVLIDDTDITRLSPTKLRQLRQRIGMVFQHFNLLASRNVYDNIAFPLEIMGKKTEIKKIVPELLELIGLTHKQYCFPHQLSGGQKQRVAIARALSSRPAILLSDEATSALDTEATQSILNLYKKINKEMGLTIFLVSHELDVVKSLCHRIGVMDHGTLIEEEDTVTLFANPKHHITKQLVSPTFDLEKLKYKNKHHSYILKLIFFGKESEEPIISSLIKKFSLDINILQAQIETIQETTLGYTICEFSGEKHNLTQALAYLNNTTILVEVIHAPL